MGDVRRIPVTADNVWFLRKQINLFDILDFFPEDALGAPVEADNGTLPSPVRYLTIDTDAGFSFETDIPRDKFIFRQQARTRPGTGKWAEDRDLRPGDTVCIEKLGDHHFYLYKEAGSGGNT